MTFEIFDAFGFVVDKLGQVFYRHFNYIIVIKNRYIKGSFNNSFQLLFFTTTNILNMKFTLASISAALLAVSTVSGASIKRQDASQNETASQDQITSQYSSAIDIGSLNGTCKFL